MIQKYEIRNTKYETKFKYLNFKTFEFVSCFVLGASCLLFFVPHVFAQQGFTALAPIPGLTDSAATSIAQSTKLASFFNNLYKYLIGIAAIIAVVQIIWAGIEIAYTQKDSVSAITDRKGKIYNALLGLVLVLSPAIVFSIINPNILNLSLNIPEIKTPKTVVNNPTTPTTTTVPGRNPNFSQLSSQQQAACIGYSEFKTIQAPAPIDSAICRNTLGTGWTLVDDLCSGADIPLGSRVCGLADTTQQGQTGCTTTNYSAIFETATCATKDFASNYKCQNGLSPTIKACSTIDAQGSCVGAINVYCGKSVTVLYYAATYHAVGALISSAVVVPRDVQIQNEFTSACSSGGGKMDVSTSKGLVGNLQFVNASPGNCPIDSGVPNFTTSGGLTGQTGVTCYNRILTCQL